MKSIITLWGRGLLMSSLKNSIIKYWYLYIVCAVLVAEALVFAIFGQDSYIQIHDNLDLFVAHYQMMKLNYAWFAHGVTMPMLHGIDRDLLGSEFLLYNLLYIIFPSFVAYIIGYFLKILIGLTGFVLLAKDIYGERFVSYKAVAYIVGLAYGLIPVFPTYGIAFTSMPLIVFLLRRLYFAGGQKPTLTKVTAAQSASSTQAAAKPGLKSRLLLYLGVFLYPLLSYFSYHGFFILAYMCVAVIILWIRDKRFPKTIFASIIVLAAGYITFEYRLFKAMLFDDTITIRTSMVRGDLSLGESLKLGLSELVNASFHSEDSHTYFILIVAVIALVIINVGNIRSARVQPIAGTTAGTQPTTGSDTPSIAKRILTDPINLIFGWIVFNSLIYGLCEFEPFRTLLETIVPPLKGFDFSRTSFFNPFLWYALLFLICVRIIDMSRGIGTQVIRSNISSDISADAMSNSDSQVGPVLEQHEQQALLYGNKKLVSLAPTIAMIALAVVALAPQTYNDFYYTVYNQAYKLIKQQDTYTVNFREFYSTDLFNKVQEDINYNNEWSAAYGLHPAVLNYNGIASVDGYLGMYSQDYKEQWIKIEEEAFAGSPSLKDYYEGWGARVCLYSGNDENTYAPLRVMDPEDKSLKADMDGLKALQCRYIFSRIELSNAKEKNLSLRGVYTDDSSPYTIYVYEIK